MRTRWVALLVGLLLAALVWLAAGRIAGAQNSMVDGDFFSFWLAGRTVVNGENPYAAALWVENHARYGATWISDETFLYPLPLALLFAPLGMLALPAAAQLWVFLSILMISAALALQVRSWGGGWQPAYLLPIVAGAFTFRPVLVTLMNGQAGALWLLACTGTIWLWRQERWLWGGVLLSLLALKPSFGLPLIGLAGLWLLVSRRWAGLAGLAAGGLGLALLGWLYDPAWVGRYLVIGRGKAAGNFGWSPTFWGALNVFSDCPVGTLCSPGAGMLVAGLAVCTALGLTLLVVFLRWQRYLGSERCLALCAASAVLMAPYLWAYDQILLLLPVTAAVGYLRRRRAPYLLAASLPLGVSVLALALVGLALQVGHDVSSVFLALVGLGLAILTLDPRFEPIRSSREQAL